MDRTYGTSSSDRNNRNRSETSQERRARLERENTIYLKTATDYSSSHTNNGQRTPQGEIILSPEGREISAQKYMKSENDSSIYKSLKERKEENKKLKYKNKQFMSLEEWDKKEEQKKGSNLEHIKNHKNELESILVDKEAKLIRKFSEYDLIQKKIDSLNEKKSVYDATLSSLQDRSTIIQEKLDTIQRELKQILEDEKSTKKKFIKEKNNLDELQEEKRNFQNKQLEYIKTYKDAKDQIFQYQKEIEQQQYIIEQHEKTAEENKNLFSLEKSKFEQQDQRHLIEKDSLELQLGKAESEASMLLQRQDQTASEIHLVSETIKDLKQLQKDLELLSSKTFPTDWNSLEKELILFKESHVVNVSKTKTLEDEIQIFKNNLDSIREKLHLDHQANILETLEQVKDLPKNLQKSVDQERQIIHEKIEYCQIVNKIHDLNLELPTNNTYIPYGSIRLNVKDYIDVENILQEKTSKIENLLSTLHNQKTEYNKRHQYYQALKNAYTRIIDSAENPAKEHTNLGLQLQSELSAKLQEFTTALKVLGENNISSKEVVKGWMKENEKVKDICNRINNKNIDMNKIQKTCHESVEYMSERLRISKKEEQQKLNKKEKNLKETLQELFLITKGYEYENRLLSNIIPLYREEIKETEEKYELLKENRFSCLNDIKDNIQHITIHQEKQIKEREDTLSQLNKEHALNTVNINVKNKELNAIKEKIRLNTRTRKELQLNIAEITHKEKEEQLLTIKHKNTIDNLNRKILMEREKESRAKELCDTTNQELQSIQEKIHIAKEIIESTEKDLQSINSKRSSYKEDLRKKRENSDNPEKHPESYEEQIIRYKKQQRKQIAKKENFINEVYKGEIENLQQTSSEILSLQGDIQQLETQLKQIKLDIEPIEHQKFISEIANKLRQENAVTYWMKGGDTLNTSFTNIIRFSKLLRDKANDEFLNRDHTNELLNSLHKNLESFFKSVDQKSDTLHIYQTLLDINKELENIRNTLPN